MTTKLCSRCKKEKDLTCFHKNKTRSFGRHEYCKDCRKEENPQAAKRSAKNYEENKQDVLQKMSLYYQKNKQKKQQYGKEHYKQNSWKYKANARNRKHFIKLATPIWYSSEELFLIQEAYHLAELRSTLTGFLWEVDHYYPLRGKTVCGLNCIENLQVIPKTENNRKRNKHPDLFYATKK